MYPNKINWSADRTAKTARSEWIRKQSLLAILSEPSVFCSIHGSRCGCEASKLLWCQGSTWLFRSNVHLGGSVLGGRWWKALGFSPMVWSVGAKFPPATKNCSSVASTQRPGQAWLEAELPSLLSRRSLAGWQVYRFYSFSGSFLWVMFMAITSEVQF